MRISIKVGHAITGLGFDQAGQFRLLCDGVHGISLSPISASNPALTSVAAVDPAQLTHARDAWDVPADLSRLEALLMISIKSALKQFPLDMHRGDTLVLIASTKGNIDLLDRSATYPEGHPIHLLHSARRMCGIFGLTQTPVVMSHACTSGLMAVIHACRLLEGGRYRHAVVSGVDVLSTFTLTGFQALGAIDPEPCKPYDEARAGINLGEGCGTIILSANPEEGDLCITGGGNSNDANHISGPSRTGSGLIQAVQAALRSSGGEKIDYINAHGTATLYNDEMEAQAFHQLGMQDIPLNSTKGYWGHTLGAAGIIELISVMWSMQAGYLYPSLGFQQNGLTLPLNIITHPTKAALQRCLKTSSGFGGSNSAVVIEKG